MTCVAQMALPLLNLFLLILTFTAPATSDLSVGFCNQICPNAEKLVYKTMADAYRKNPVSSAAVLRLFFHDCAVQGCDGSVLIDSAGTHAAEKDALLNSQLRFMEVIDDAKSAVEEECPETVSCADILAFAARDAVVLTGGPRWEVEAGRRDGISSSSALANASLPSADMSVAELDRVFRRMSLSQEDMVILSGGHTLGEASCVVFSNRLRPELEPILQTAFGRDLLEQCPVGSNDRVSLDYTSPNRFDNNYYRNLVRGRGLLFSDQVLYENYETQYDVQSLADDQDRFFEKFADAMIRMGRTGVLTGRSGEIRRNCRFFNNDW